MKTMLVKWLIWAIVLLICIAARPDKYEYGVDTVEAVAMQQKMETSRKVRHLEMKLQVAKDLEGLTSKALTRQKRSFELHDWLTESQKQEIRKMESEGASKTELRDKILAFFEEIPQSEKEKWNEYYKKMCFDWIKTVASSEEIEELKKSSKDIDRYKAKLNQYKSRLSADKRQQVDLWQDSCDKLLGLDVQQRMLRRLRRDLSQYSGYAHTLTSEQIASLEDMRADGATDADIERKVEEYYLALPEYKRRELELQFKAKCTGWIEEVADENDIQQLRMSFKKGNQLVFNTLIEEYFERLSKERQEALRHLKETCREVWREAMIASRAKRSVDDDYHEWISWMNNEQKNELQQMHDSGSSFDDIHKKINGHFVKLPETVQKQLLNDYKEKCRNYFLTMTNEDEFERLNAAYTKKDHIQYKNIIEEILHRQPEDVRNKAYKFHRICDDVYHKQASRGKRDIDALIEKHLSWLTSEQKAEIKRMKANGESLAAIKAKLLGYIKQMRNGEQQHVTEKTRRSCYAWLNEVTTAEERAELERLHQTDHSACKKKIREYIKRLSPEKQEAVNRDLEVCEHIWYGGHHGHGHHHQEHHRARRAHHREHRINHLQVYSRQVRDQNSLQAEDSNAKIENEWIEEEMSWLSPQQIHQLRELREKNRALITEKLLQFIEATDRDKRQIALRKLADRCRQARYFSDEDIADAAEHILRFGAVEAQFAEVLKHAKPDRMDLEDENELLNRRVCVRIHQLALINERPKRNHVRRETADHHHSLEHYFSTHLKWLNEKQKAELSKIKKDGGSNALLQQKVMEYYESLNGEEKNEAKEQLRAGCRELLRHLLSGQETNELKEMREAGKGAEEIHKRVEEMMMHKNNEKQKELYRTYAPTCRKVYGLESYAGHHHHHHHHHHHNLEGYFQTNLKWLSAEQKEELRRLKKEGKTKVEIQEKIFHYYETLNGEAKQHANEQLREACLDFIKDVIGEKKAFELKEMIASGASKEEIKVKLEEVVGQLVDERKKAQIKEYWPVCNRILESTELSRKRRHGDYHQNHNLEHYFQTHLSWLSEEQKQKLREMKEKDESREEMQKQIMIFYEELSGEQKVQATEQLRGACNQLMSQILGKEKTAELKHLKDSGATLEDLKAKVDRMLETITEPAKKEKIKAYRPLCQKIYAAMFERHKRNDENVLKRYLETYLSWLTNDQKNEVRKMKEEGKSRAEIQEKVLEFYDGLSMEKKKEATEKLRIGCNELLKNIIGEEKFNELKQLKDSGASLKQLQVKVDELLGHITDESKKQKILEYGSACRRIYAEAYGRHKRDHSGKLEGYFQTYLKWLTDSQKDEIRKMKKDGNSRADIQRKVMEYYDKLEGEEKKHASEELQEGCRHLLKQVIGEEKMEHLKALKNSGAKLDEMKTTVDQFLAEITDETKKEKINEYGSACRKIYENAMVRHKRDKTKNNLEQYLNSHLQWLTESQKNEVRKMKEEGKSLDDIRKSVFNYYEELTGEAKEKAGEHLRSGCKEIIGHLVGQDRMNELRAMKDGGASTKELRDKVEEMLSTVTEKSKVEEIKAYRPYCSKLFASEGHVRRKREDHSEHSVDDHFESASKWFTAQQKDEFKKMKEDGKSRTDLDVKMLQYYDQLSGEAKQNVGEILHCRCRQILREVVGEEHYKELKEMKDSGASEDNIKSKVEKMLDEVEDEAKKEKIKIYRPGCGKIFAVMRHELEEYFKNRLKWLSDEQKNELRTMKKEGKSKAEIQEKLMHFYENLSGAKKEEATKSLRDTCYDLIKYVLNDEEVAELKKMKESGASVAEMQLKIEAMVKGIKDEHKKAKAKEYGPACRKILSEYHKNANHTLEHYFHTYLNWLSEEQKEELRKMKDDKKPAAEIQEKVLNFLDHLHGDAKCHAVDTMYKGCRDMLQFVLSSEKYAEIKKMKESGAGPEELKNKLKTLLEEVKDAHKKEQIKKYGEGCWKIFKIAQDHKNHKHHDVHSLEHYLESHLKWLTSGQKEELKKMKEEKKSKAEFQEKILHYYNDLKGDEKDHATDMLHGACRMLFKDAIGDEKYKEFQKFKNTRPELDKVSAKVLEMIAEVKDEAKKKRFEEYKTFCFKVCGNWYTKHQNELKLRTLEDFFQKDLSWLTEEQKNELLKMREDGKSRAEREDKVIEFLDKLDDAKKQNAVALIQGSCRIVLKKVLGEEKAAELKRMRDSGANIEDVKKKADEFLEKITDEYLKKKSLEYGKPCRKAITLASEFEQKHEHKNRTINDYLKHELKWLTDDEQKELRHMKEEGKTRKEMLDKVMDYYKKAEGSTKDEATAILKKTCNNLLRNVLNEEQVKELKEMKETGKTFDDIDHKFHEFLDKVTDEHKKKAAGMYGFGCKEVYKYSMESQKNKKEAVAARFKRLSVLKTDNNVNDGVRMRAKHSVQDHSLENYFTTYLKWLAPEQKEKLRKMKTEGKSRAEIQSKIFEFFENASGETKKTAARSLQEGCQAMFREIGGEKKAKELDLMMHSDAVTEKLEEKIDEMIDSIENESEKAQVMAYAAPCKHLYGIHAVSKI